MEEKMVLKSWAGGVIVQYGAMEEKVDLSEHEMYFNMVMSVALEPYLYEDNVPQVKVEEWIPDGGKFKRDKYTITDRERIMRIIYLIEKMRSHGVVYADDVYGYGTWKPHEVYNRIMEQHEQTKNDNYRYLEYNIYQESIILTTIDKGVLDAVERGEQVSLRKVRDFGSLIYPMYKKRVATNYSWIFYSIDEVIESEYESALRSAIENAKGNYGPTPKEYVEEMKKYLSPRRDLINEFLLISMYLGDFREKREFWIRVIKKLRELIKDNMFLKSGDFEYAGEFRSGLLKDLRKLEMSIGGIA